MSNTTIKKNDVFRCDDMYNKRYGMICTVGHVGDSKVMVTYVADSKKVPMSKQHLLATHKKLRKAGDE